MSGKTGFWRAAFIAAALASTSPAAAQSLQQRVESALSAAGPGTRFGLVVTSEDGREILAIRPDDRFIPASNTKMFTTAAAFATLGGIDRPDQAGGASVRLEAEGRRVPNVVLKGRGDARLSSAPGCKSNCLAELAEAVAARARVVGEVVGDDSFFPDQRWSPGMSWNNVPTRSGTAISALSLDDNEATLKVAPSAVGQPPKLETIGYFTIDNRATTSGGGATSLSVDRLPGETRLRLTGTIAAGSEPELLRLGIDDPAHYAAWRLKTLLQERGVRVTGGVAVRHRPLSAADDPKTRGIAPAPRPPEPEALAQLVPPPLAEDLREINKVSQNLHAELMLRRVGREAGAGSIADGMQKVHEMLAGAGVPRWAYDLSDGSGMSTYNRVAPRGMTIFLRWIAAQPWAAAWRATLPVAGVDGTLGRRFRGTPLEGRLFAKTGTLNATNALSGYMIAKSGRTLIFSAFANDVPEGGGGARFIDSALELIAAEN